MEAARSAVNKITGRTGHRTDVDEQVMPAVTSETIKPHRHEETTEAVDREVHQDHYHTTVQPIAHREQLPEKHVHNLAPQVNREFRHGDEQETQRRVESELGQFRNTSTVQNTTHSTSAAAAVAGEHVHHHVHETVQPVIHKETIQPEVVHTTVPIHETIHQKATHHGMSALPMKSLDEFKQSGGVLSGSQSSSTHEHYDGQPRPYNEKLSTTIEKVLPGHHGQSGNTTGGVLGSTHGTSGTTHGTSGALGSTGRQGYGDDVRGTSGSTGVLGSTGRQGYTEETYGTTGTHGSSGLTGTHGSSGLTDTHGSSGLAGNTSRLGNTSTTTNTTTSTSTSRGGLNEKFGEIGEHDRGAPGYPTSSQTDSHYSNADTSGGQQHKKPSLLDKLNPMKDADGDGKAGFMK